MSEYFDAADIALAVEDVEVRPTRKQRTTNQYALGYKAGLEAAVKVCDELYKHDRKSSGYDEGWNDALDVAEQAIRARGDHGQN